ncbi:hypothetical protein [Chryseobacterium sp.]|uniref:hypothetical protein n=1 Tax=Chryseobacterium sp. TaxID=1871047 RepID=UPI0028A0EE18|nr:hypothetical protein [Chryseobacterium sp.]
MRLILQILFLVLFYSNVLAQKKVEKLKLIKTDTYTIQVPKSWKKIEFDQNKYELAFATKNNENSIFFNVAKCFKSFSAKSKEGEFGFGKMRINILSETLKNTDETYCGNIDIMNRNEVEIIFPILESLNNKVINER